MIYFDSAYVVKCYRNEPGAERVRELARREPGLCSCDIARLEFMCTIHRHLREGHITPGEARQVFVNFGQDIEAGVWEWLPVTAGLISDVCERVKQLPRNVFLRTGDALHLGCAREQAFTTIYTNDRHMLEGAAYFGLTGVDVLR